MRRAGPVLRLAIIQVALSTPFAWGLERAIGGDAAAFSPTGFGFLLVVTLQVGAVYLAPAYVAFSRRHPRGAVILVLNAFTGWTIMGWIAALAWAAAREELPGAGRRGPTPPP